MGRFRIREFRKPDFRRLWEIDRACFVSGIAYSQEELAYYMTRRTAFTIVAEADPGSPALAAEADPGRRTVAAKRQGADKDAPQIAGFLVAQTVRSRGDEIGHIITIDILPDARRSGLGSELMAIAEQRLAATGCQRVSLEVAVDNSAAIRFYQRLGYSIARTIPRYYNRELDALEMEKEISPQRRGDREEKSI